ncbi:hypothetical protein GCM10010341_81530 [Streptomyces noursei]|nr:hypothetical protein GCM10010341_81530 [Streptomyces noursei]
MSGLSRRRSILSNTVTDGDTANLTFEVYTTDVNGNPKDQVKLTDPDTGKAAAYGVVCSASSPSAVPRRSPCATAT